MCYLTYFVITITINTVKPVFKDHPLCKAKVVYIWRRSLITNPNTLDLLFNNTIIVVFEDEWSLNKGGL